MNKQLILGLQHLFAMFGATILVPALTGMNPSVALIFAGIGTFIFHVITQHKVPVFVGSSFAYIAAISLAVQNFGISAAQSGIIAAGFVYIILSIIVRFIGAEKIKKLFPPVVTGPIIVVIGLTLAPTGIAMAQSNWAIAIIVLIIVVAISAYAKGFYKLVPILIGLVSGYILCLILDMSGILQVSLIDTSIITNASWINPIWKFDGTFFSLPSFNIEAITMIAPIALVTFMEHIGDITTNGSVVSKDFFKDPGLHKTLLGDGFATIAAGFFGAPPNTTYSENTGVMAVTKVYSTIVLKIAAIFAIILGVVGKFGAIIQTIPDSVKGGISIVLFGMIAAVGMRTLKEANLDFTHSRNMLIVALILVLGLGMSSGIMIGNITISGLFIAVSVGAIANLILPKED